MKSREIVVATEKGDLKGDLALEERGGGLVIFAHGSGSSRFSSRNRFVAQKLNDCGLSTLLFDLLTRDEERVDDVTMHLRFDIGLLADRLIEVTNWARHYPPVGEKSIKIGYFGASTGAAAALVAAAKIPDAVSAIVSRGGRPDLAQGFLERVRAPTLLIVGEQDPDVMELNAAARRKLERTQSELKIVPRASHLFEEPGALEQVAKLAGEWFVQHLAERTEAEEIPETRAGTG